MASLVSPDLVTEKLQATPQSTANCHPGEASELRASGWAAMSCIQIPQTGITEKLVSPELVAGQL